MLENVMLTTIDNPFDPFTEFDEWLSFDESKGYYTCSYLARFAYTSPDLSDIDQRLSVETAMSEIVSNNPLGIYKIVTKKDSETLSEQNQEKETVLV